MVNKEEIYHRLNEIRDALDFLGKLTHEILADHERLLLARYYLQIMLEATFTIGNQIIANAGFRKPKNYKDILTVLSEEKVLNAKQLQTLVPYADLRNRLVHTYWKISTDELLEISKQLSVFKEFVGLVVEYTEKN